MFPVHNSVMVLQEAQLLLSCSLLGDASELLTRCGFIADGDNRVVPSSLPNAAVGAGLQAIVATTLNSTLMLVYSIA